MILKRPLVKLADEFKSDVLKSKPESFAADCSERVFIEILGPCVVDTKLACIDHMET